MSKITFCLTIQFEVENPPDFRFYWFTYSQNLFFQQNFECFSNDQGQWRVGCLHNKYDGFFFLISYGLWIFLFLTLEIDILMTKAGKCVAWRSVGHRFCWDGPGPSTTWRDCSSGMQQNSYILKSKMFLRIFFLGFCAECGFDTIFGLIFSCDMQKMVTGQPLKLCYFIRWSTIQTFVSSNIPVRRCNCEVILNSHLAENPTENIVAE